MNKKLVSIIIPFFNRINQVEKSLKSAINQTYNCKEIILINDGSTESIEKIERIVAHHQNIFLLNNKFNSGVSYSRNLGLKFSKGEFIAFLDSDDEWLNFKIQLQMDYIKKHSVNFTYTAYHRRDKVKSRFSTIYVPKEYKMPFMAFSCKIATPTVLVKKNLTKNLRFNEDIKYGEDLIYWAKLSAKTRLIGINIPTTYVNVSSDTSSSSINKQRLGFENIKRELFYENKLISFLHIFFYKLNLAIKTLLEIFYL